MSVELFSYVSTKHILKNGFCCDISNSQSECQDDCDNRFIFCLRRTGSGGLSCPSNSTTYQTSNTSPDFVIFSSGVDIDDGVPNPLIFTGERWPVRNSSIRHCVCLDQANLWYLQCISKPAHCRRNGLSLKCNDNCRCKHFGSLLRKLYCHYNSMTVLDEHFARLFVVRRNHCIWSKGLL